MTEQELDAIDGVVKKHGWTRGMLYGSITGRKIKEIRRHIMYKCLSVSGHQAIANYFGVVTSTVGKSEPIDSGAMTLEEFRKWEDTQKPQRADVGFTQKYGKPKKWGDLRQDRFVLDMF